MKKLLVLIALLCTSVFAQNSFNGDGTIKDRRFVKTFVKNSASATLAAGATVCHDLTADDGISVDTCAAKGSPAAYCMVTESCAVGKMCECLLEGYTSILKFDGNSDGGVAGAAVYAHTDGLAAGVTVDTTAEAAYKIIGTFLDAVSTSVTVEAYLKF
jgi:hypothetical protein